jgi:hypothetical protein
VLEETKVFIIEKGQPDSNFQEAICVHDLAFLINIFGHLNDLHSKLQGNTNLQVKCNTMYQPSE